MCLYILDYRSSRGIVHENNEGKSAVPRRDELRTQQSRAGQFLRPSILEKASAVEDLESFLVASPVLSALPCAGIGVSSFQYEPDPSSGLPPARQQLAAGSNGYRRQV